MAGSTDFKISLSDFLVDGKLSFRWLDAEKVVGEHGGMPTRDVYKVEKETCCEFTCTLICAYMSDLITSFYFFNRVCSVLQLSIKIRAVVKNRIRE